MPLNLESVDFDNIESISKENDQNTLHSTMSEAVKVNPEQYAKQLKLSKDTGVPVEAVDESVKQHFDLNSVNFNDINERSPATAKHLSNFDNAVIAQDDISILQSIEEIFNPKKTFKNIGETVKLGFNSQGLGFQLKGVDMTPTNIKDLIPSSAMPPGMESEAQMMSVNLAEQFGVTTDLQLQELKKSSTEKMLAELRTLQEQRGELTPDDMNLLEQGVRSGIESLANMAPGTALMLLSGGRATPLLATMGLQTYADSYGSGRADGLSPQEASWYATIDSVIEVGTEILPTKTLETIITGNSKGLAKDALKFAIREMGTEQLATLGQSLNAYMFGLDKEMEQAETISEKVQIQLNRQAITAIATVVAGGAQITAATGLRKSIEAVTQDKNTKETKGQVEQNNIDRLNEKATNSKLRERDKESFKSFVEQADGENNTNVFIDGAQAALYLQSKTPEEIKSDPALSMLSDKAREASNLGGDIHIPVAEFATEIAGTEHFDQLRDSMTMSAESISPFRQEQVKQETDSFIKNLMAEAQESSSEYVEAQDIYNKVRDQLIDTGAVTPANASIMSQIVPAWATAQARRQGKTVQQVYQDSGLTIEGPQTGERTRLEGEMVLEQDTSRLKELSDRYDEDFDFTVNDFVDDVENLIEDSDIDVTGELQKAVDKYRQEQRDDLALGGRNDMDQAADEFTAVVDRILSAQSPVKPVQLKNEGDVNLIETGKPVSFNFIHNTESATKIFGKPKPGDTYGRDLEPSGRYINIASEDIANNVEGTLISGKLTFTNPLVIEADGSKWKKKLSEQYDNKTGKELSKAIIADGHDGIITTEKNYISEAVDFTTFDETKALFQSPVKEDQNLFIAHNLSVANLIHADKMGGIAAPSLAIASTETGFDNFGEISLIADKSLLQDPKAKTFGADIYSPRYPTVKYQIDWKWHDKIIGEADKKLESLGLRSIQSDIEDSGIQDLYYDTGARYLFLESINKAPKLTYTKKESIPDYLRKFKGSQYQISDNAEFQEAAKQYYKDKAEKNAKNISELGKEEAAEEGYTDTYEYWLKDWTETYFNEEGEVYHRHLSDLAGTVNDYHAPKKVNTYALDKKINKILESDDTQGQFKQWLDDTFSPVVANERIFTGYTPSGNRKYIAHTLDNVIKIMNKKLRGGENFNYGVGTIRSAIAPQFKTIKQIQNARGKIVSSDVMENLKKEASKEFDKIAEEIKPYYEYDSDRFGYYDAAAENLFDMARGKGLPDFKNVPADVKTNAAEFLAKLRDMPTEYFEAKIQRGVTISEFDTAIVPNNTPVKALSILKDAGLKIEQYDPSVEGARAAAIAKHKELLFQDNKSNREARGYYDPANSIIRLTEAADLSTFLHEFAHFMYEMEVKGNTEMLQSINNWFKRNAEDVAKEANTYLGENFDMLKQGEYTNNLIPVSGIDFIDLEKKGYDQNNPFTHDGGNISKIEKKGIFDGVFTKSGYVSNAGLGVEGVKTTFFIKGDVAGKGDDFVENYDHAIKWLKDEVPDLTDDQYDQLYEMVMGDNTIEKIGYNPLISLFPSYADAEWEAQRLRGQYAADLGYGAVAMRDETGTSYLIPYQTDVAIFKQTNDFDERKDIYAQSPLNQIKGRPMYRGQPVDSELRLNEKGLLWVTPEKEYADDPHYGGKKNAEVIQINVDESKLNIFDYRNEDHANKLRQNKSPLFRSAANGDFRALSDDDVIEFIKSEGYEGFYAIEPEGQESLALFNVPESFAQPTKPPSSKQGSITADDVVAYLDNNSTGDVDKDAAIRRAVHEQFARGFEAYLLEGKAPSIELRNAFRAFARWLARIYQSLKNKLNVKLDDDMRHVFDRMIATEEQIQAAEARARVEPMFTDAAMAGMTEQEFADYKARQEKVKDVQSETLRDKIIKQLTRQTKSWWKEEKQDIIDEEIETLSKQQVYVARARLRDGDIKLDHATVKEMVGEQFTNKLGKTSTVIPSKLSGMTAKGATGVHPDEAAAFFGYRSGSEMLKDLIDAPSIKAQAEVNAEIQMIERHGDILTDGTIEQQADEAIQNEERGKLILHELRIIARGTNAPTIDRSTIKHLSEERIGRLSFREIHPGKYRKAEIRAAQESVRMLAEGNKEGAAAAKMRQVMNYYLGMAANNAKNETTRIVDRMARYNKKKVREAIQKVDGGYWDQIVKILERFEFRKSATLNEVESLNTWVKERMESVGDGLVLTNSVLNESYVTHWKNVPFSDLQGINDSVKNIEHVARYADKMTLLKDEIEFKNLISKLVTHIQSVNEPSYKPAEAIDITKDKHGIGWSTSQMTKIPWLVRELDGGEAVGFVHEVIMQPINDANHNELTIFDGPLKAIYEMLDKRDTDDRKRHNSTIYIKELEGTATGPNLRGHQILAVALNTGNQGNLKKMLLGEGWANPENEAEITFDNPKLQAVLSHLTESDVLFIQEVWDQMETLYPQLAEVHRRTTGETPPKVEATPVSFRTSDGGVIETRGGYYPLKEDPMRSRRARENEKRADESVMSMFTNGTSIQATVNAGATNERTKAYYPIKLSLEVVPEHFQEVIHFITHHDPVRQINKIIRNAEFESAAVAVVGQDEFNQLALWLNDVAKAGKNAPNKTFIDAAFGQLRMGVTLGIMGFKASTGIIQTLGVTQTFAEVGAGHTFEGYKITINNGFIANAFRGLFGSEKKLQSGMNFALERSKVMPHRIKTMDREMFNAFNEIGKSVDIKAETTGLVSGATNVIKAIRRSRMLRKSQEISLIHIALIQMYSVDLPAWHAAYSKGLSEWGDEDRSVRYADWVIENTQGSGSVKDMSQLMRNQSKIHTSFTMFMTFFSSLWNIMRGLGRDVKKRRLTPGAIIAKITFLFFLPNLIEMFLRGDLTPGSDEDEYDVLQRYLLQTAMYPAQSIPFYRDIANGVTGNYGYTINPVGGVLEKGIEGMAGGVTALLDDNNDVSLYQIKGISKLIGAVLGVPGINQMWATGEHLYDVIEEGEDFTMHQLLFGPERK